MPKSRKNNKTIKCDKSKRSKKILEQKKAEHSKI